jgi:predicted PurR-regulated permease PerM
MEGERQFSVYFLFGGIAVFGALTFVMVLPFLTTAALAAVAAALFYPLYLRILKATGRREGLAAGLTVLIVMIIAVGLAAFFSYQIIREAQGIYGAAIDPTSGFRTGLQSVFDKLPETFFPGGRHDPAQYVQQGLGWIFSNFGSAFSGTLGGLIDFLIGLIAFYYCLKDGRQFLDRLVEWSPISNKYAKGILVRLGAAVNAVIKGSLIVAAIQGFLSGIGYAVFGVPNPVLWGAVTAVAALIPGIGTATVLTPAVIYLFVSGQNGSAIGLFIWGAIAVGLIDNFLGPKLIERGINIHPFFILMAVLGGVSVFGPAGFILGPLTLALLFALLDTYADLKSAG